MFSRRMFLQQASAATVAAGLMPVADRALWGRPPAEFLPDPDEEKELKELVLGAMDEARRLGASFADIRINAARMMQLGVHISRGSKPADDPQPWVGFGGAYGIRAIVDGSWGFAAAFGLTNTDVVNAVRLAVEGARTNKARRARDIELAPRPVVDNGRWEVKVERDPFTVPILDQLALVQAGAEPVRTSTDEAVQYGTCNAMWRKCLTMYASTDGSFIVQPIFTSSFGVGVTVLGAPHDWQTRYDMGIPGFLTGPYGYEAAVEKTLDERVRAGIEKAIEVAKRAANPEPAEVGRFDLVLSPMATAGLLTMTVAEALRLSRVLGYEANDAGTSFAGPPADVLGKYKIGAPMFTLHADRSQPKACATVGWDDEGVKPQDFTVVKDGVVVDYFADRQMASELKDWYQSQGRATVPYGVTRRTGEFRPEAMVPNLTMEPGKAAADADAMIRGTKRGYYVEGFFGTSDQQVINSQVGCARPLVRRITNGKLGPHAKDLSFQFITTPFWKSMDAIGGAASAVSYPFPTDNMAVNQPYQPWPWSTIRAVPIRVRDVNVLNSGRTA